MLKEFIASLLLQCFQSEYTQKEMLICFFFSSLSVSHLYQGSAMVKAISRQVVFLFSLSSGIYMC